MLDHYRERKTTHHQFARLEVVDLTSNDAVERVAAAARSRGLLAVHEALGLLWLGLHVGLRAWTATGVSMRERGG